jgi:hypothetical protein
MLAGDKGSSLLGLFAKEGYNIGSDRCQLRNIVVAPPSSAEQTKHVLKMVRDWREFNGSK